MHNTMSPRRRICTSFSAKTIICLLSTCTGTSLRFYCFAVDFFSQCRRVEPQSLKSFFQYWLRSSFSSSGCTNSFRVLTIAVVNTIEPSACPDRDVVRVDLPVNAEPHLATSSRSVDSVSGEGEVFWTISGPKGKANWQVLPTPSKNG